MIALEDNLQLYSSFSQDSVFPFPIFYLRFISLRKTEWRGGLYSKKNLYVGSVCICLCLAVLCGESTHPSHQCVTGSIPVPGVICGFWFDVAFCPLSEGIFSSIPLKRICIKQPESDVTFLSERLIN